MRREILFFFIIMTLEHGQFQFEKKVSNNNLVLDLCHCYSQSMFASLFITWNSIHWNKNNNKKLQQKLIQCHNNSVWHSCAAVRYVFSVCLFYFSISMKHMHTHTCIQWAGVHLSYVYAKHVFSCSKNSTQIKLLQQQHHREQKRRAIYIYIMRIVIFMLFAAERI